MLQKKVSNKLKQESYTPQTKRRKNNKSKPTQPKEKTVTASRVRKLVANELRYRNRSDLLHLILVKFRKYITTAKSKR